ncbi:MAG TPA: adenosylhomocysteinase [Roseiarcus sp.]
MKTRIDWVRENCLLLNAISEEFGVTQPFARRTIGTGIHLEPKTVALLMTLQKGGARVVSTGNLNTTQLLAVERLRDEGVTVIGGPTTDLAEHKRNLEAVLDHQPDMLLDNGGDLFNLWRQRRHAGLLGGTEETTSGRMRLAPLRAELAIPILVINDSPIKQFAENEHAVGQSVLESYIRITNRVTNGQRVTVFGYGACGRGVAANFRAANAKVSVVDRDPLKRLQAHLDGFDTPNRNRAIASADVIVTVTGGRDIVGPDDLPLFKDGAILANAGHFPVEIGVEGIAASQHVIKHERFVDDIEVLTLTNTRVIRILAGGHMVNLAGPRPMGNSIESMDLGFALQARCLEAVALGRVGAADCVVPVPRTIDEKIAEAFLTLHYAST